MADINDFEKVGRTKSFAKEWNDSWNAHDLYGILNHS